MRRIESLTVITCLLLASTDVPAQTVWFVDASATGSSSGHSWSDALNDLQSALTAASTGDEIWIAAGTYLPGTSRSSTFHVPDGIKLIGGFMGTETEASQRPIGHLPETILSGDLLQNDAETPTCQFIGECIQYGGNVLCTQGRCDGLPSSAENSFHVMTTSTCGPTTLIDGIVIEGGAANFWASDDVDGAGVRNANGSAQFVRGTFRNNFAYRQGAGFFNNAGSPTLTDCIFADNEAAYTSAGRGGGFYNGSGSVTLNHCLFIRNSVGHAGTFFGGGQVGRGGGFHNGTGHVVLSDCTFIDNRSYRQGGALYHGGGTMQMTGCTFLHNWSDNLGGGALWLAGPATLRSTYLGFNRTESVGAGATLASAVDWIDCVLEGNSAIGQGGGAYLSASATPVTFTGTTLTGNETQESGGAMHAEGLPAILEIRGCSFTENRAYSGGAILNKRSGLLVNQSRFSANTATSSGGAIEHRFGRAHILSNIFDANQAERGGALFTQANPVVASNTIVGNSATETGGGLFHAGGKATISSNIFWGNVADESPAGGQLAGDLSAASIRYCNIQRSSVFPIGVSTYDSNPQFVTPLGWDNNPLTYADNDYHLSEESPCIGQGDPARPGGDNSPDIDGQPRFDGCRSDIGADEVMTSHTAGDFTSDGQVDLRDFGDFQLCTSTEQTALGSIATCHCVFDFDLTNEVNEVDFSLFLNLFAGP